MKRRGPRSVGTQTALLAIGTAAAQIITAILFIASARLSGPTNFGIVAVSISIGMVLAGLVDFGSNTLLTRERSAGRISRRELNRALISKIIIVSGASSASALTIGVHFPEALPATIIFGTNSIIQTAFVPLRAARRGDIVAVITLGDRLGALVAFLTFLSLQVPADTALWVSLCVGSTGAATAATIFTPVGSRVHFRRFRFRNPWKATGYFGLNGIAASAQQLDLFVLTTAAGAQAGGVYGAVNRWTQPMGLVSAAFSSAAMPYVAAARNWASARLAISSSFWMLWIGSLACLALFFVAPIMVPVLLGQSYSASVGVLQLLAIGTIPAIFNQPMASALQARKKEKPVALAFLLAVIVQLILVAILSSALGVIGGALAFCIMQFTLFTSLLIIMTVSIRNER